MNAIVSAPGQRARRRGVWPVMAACSALAMPGIVTPARANLMISATFAPSITSDPNAAVIETALNAAVGVLESDISTSTTASIYFQEFSSGLGESQTAFYTLSYFDYYNQLAAIDGAPGASAAQKSALASLGPAPTSESSGNPVNGSLLVGLTAPNLRAIGVAQAPGVSAGGGMYDTVISLNTSITSPPGTLNGSTYGLQSVAAHELDEALGIGGSGSFIGTSYVGSPVGVLDLFRYSATGVRSYSATASSSYFSADGGASVVSYFNQTAPADYGDWLSNPIPSGFGPQVQDAFGEQGTDPALGPNELEALNVVGYELATPEPASLAILLPGVIGLLGLRRRTRAARPASV